MALGKQPDHLIQGAMDNTYVYREEDEDLEVWLFTRPHGESGSFDCSNGLFATLHIENGIARLTVRIASDQGEAGRDGYVIYDGPLRPSKQDMLDQWAKIVTDQLIGEGDG